MSTMALESTEKRTAFAHQANRLAPLDGLRAIAIFWVTIYHYFDFWTPRGRGDALLPYGNLFFDVPMAATGWMGVSLFFMVSGFVILMTLQRTTKLFAFAIRRIARIFPTLMLCGLITWLVTLAIGPAELQRNTGEFLLSIFSLPPEHIGPLFGQHGWAWLDGAYWSLWVELRFYAVIGVIYFTFRSAWIPVWFVFQAIAGILMISMHLTGSYMLDRIGSLMFFEYVPLFSIGVIAYLMYSRDHIAEWMKWALAISVIHASLNALVFKPIYAVDLTYIVSHFLMLGLFFAAFVTPAIQTALSWTPLVKIGRASYSFYLLHQVLGISVLYGFAQVLPAWAIPTLALPLTLVGLVALSLLIYDRYEQPLNRYIVRRYARS